MNKQNLDEIFHKYEIEFSYNGNLGILQQKTKNNLMLAQKLEYLEIITPEDYKLLCEKITTYFTEQLKKASESIYNFIN